MRSSLVGLPAVCPVRLLSDARTQPDQCHGERALQGSFRACVASQSHLSRSYLEHFNRHAETKNWAVEQPYPLVRIASLICTWDLRLETPYDERRLLLHAASRLEIERAVRWCSRDRTNNDNEKVEDWAKCSFLPKTEKIGFGAWLPLGQIGKNKKRRALYFWIYLQQKFRFDLTHTTLFNLSIIPMSSLSCDLLQAAFMWRKWAQLWAMHLIGMLWLLSIWINALMIAVKSSSTIILSLHSLWPL